MKNEFTLAFNEVLEEKGLPKEIILKALEIGDGFRLPPGGQCLHRPACAKRRSIWKPAR